MQKKYFLLLIIYLYISTNLLCQNLHLEISGNSDYETKTIDSLNYIKKHSDYNAIKAELDTVQKTLIKKGYLENELKKIKKINDSTFVAQFHLRNKFNTIFIYYNKKDINSSVLNLISNKVYDDYFELKLNEVENALNLINSKITDTGFPFSKLKLSDIEIKDMHNLRAKLIVIATDRKRTIDNIIIKGYKNFPRSFLKHYLKIKPEQVLNLNTVTEKTSQLNDLKFANQLKPSEILFSKDSTSLYLYLEKTKSNSFDGFLGFGTNEETNNLKFDGYLNLNLTNNLNFGESFRLLYKSDENEQKTFKTDISLPYIFNSPIGIDLQLQIFKKDSSFTTVNQFLKLHYQINSKHKIYTGLINSESNNLLQENTALNITDYKTNYYSLAYEFLNPQNHNLLFPINSKFYIETNLGERKLINESQKQTQFYINTFKIFNLNKTNSIYLRFNGASLISDTYFENELFRFGGITSIRGFEENSLFSSLYGVINTEYRFLLSNTIYIHSITDTAYFENKTSKTKKTLFSYGFGIGTLTKAGLLKFNFANGKLQNQKFKLSNSKIHISLTTDF